MSLLLLFTGVASGPPPEEPKSGVSPVYNPVVQYGAREMIEVQKRMTRLDDDEIAVLFTTTLL